MRYSIPDGTRYLGLDPGSGLGMMRSGHEPQRGRSDDCRPSDKALHGNVVRLHKRWDRCLGMCVLLLADWGHRRDAIENSRRLAPMALSDTYGASCRNTGPEKRRRLRNPCSWHARRTSWWRACVPRLSTPGPGADAVFAVNPHAIYARMTGWGQHTGPWRP